MPTKKLTVTVIKRKRPDTGYDEYFDTITPGLGLRITSKGRRSYFVQARANKKQFKYKLGNTDQLTLAAAREKAREVLSNAAEGILPKVAQHRAQLEAERAQWHTFRSIAESYLDDQGKGGGANLRSKDQIKARLENDVFPNWGALPITEITKADVRELVEGIARRRPVAANRTLAVVRRIFNWACKKDRLDTSPAFGIDPPAVEKSRDRVLTDDEIICLWSAFDTIGYPYGPVFKLLLLTGQRRNEVAGMVWSEIEEDLWILPKERTKNQQSNVVPFSSLALEIVNDLPRVEKFKHLFTTGWVGDKPVHGWGDTKHKIDKIVAQNAADAAGEKLDMETHALPHWTFHDLRRTLRTDLPKLGITPDNAERVLGHKIGGVRGVYDRHAYDEEKRHALERWAQHIRSLTGEGLPTSNVVEMHRKS
ncbi:MAG: tyrosine-type recombinase/integrase [Rhodospirillales bacterium]|mgnify:CR=1 FL=1|nr:tyrosine-type recombinase/integrase [Rhodospirillales bacterium]MDP6643865.1 tyrosine-type recombinase/integrase [Rhodospirillales bacterium]